jgi:serine protease Do
MDVALVRITSPLPLPAALIGDPTELEIGQKIFTAGHPRALPGVAVTRGIISNPAQETGSLSLDIQSDAPINPGNSGGPSFNEAGEVVGMNTYTFRNGEDMTFAKPIDIQINTLAEIWDFGQVVRGALNFTVTPFPLIDRIQAGFPREITGAIVETVEKGSAAEKAGLQKGDVISWLEVRQNGSAIRSLDVNVLDYYEANGVIRRWAADLAPGTTVQALVFRKEGPIWNTLDLPIKVELLK